MFAEQPFNRLIQKVDELKRDGVIKDDVIIQTGFSTYKPQYCQWSKLIPYQILEEGKDTPFTSAKYTAQGEETSLLIDIKQDDWNKAASGSYSDTVTFTISYADSE